MKKITNFNSSNLKAKMPKCDGEKLLPKILKPRHILKKRSLSKVSNAKTILRNAKYYLLNKKLEDSNINNLDDNVGKVKNGDILEAKESIAGHVRIFTTSSIFEQKSISRKISHSDCYQNKKCKEIQTYTKEEEEDTNENIDIDENIISCCSALSSSKEIMKNSLLNAVHDCDSKKKDRISNNNQLFGSFSNLTTKHQNFRQSQSKINKLIFNSREDNSSNFNEENIPKIKKNYSIQQKVSFFKGSIPSNFEKEFDLIVKKYKIYRYNITFEEFKLILLKLRFIEKSNFIDNRLSLDLWGLLSLKSEDIKIVQLKEILKVIVGISEDKFKPVQGSTEFPLFINLDFNIIEAKQDLFDSKNNLLISKKQYKLIQKYFKSFILKRMFGRNEDCEEICNQKRNENSIKDNEKMNSKSRIPVLNKSLSEDRLLKISSLNNMQNFPESNYKIPENIYQGAASFCNSKQISDSFNFKEASSCSNRIREVSKSILK